MWYPRKGTSKTSKGGFTLEREEKKKKCQLTFRDLTVDLLGDGLDNERKRRDSWMFTSSMAALLLSKDN